MSGASSKAVRRDLRRAFGDGMVETLERRHETLEHLLTIANAQRTVLIHLDARVTALEERTLGARWRRLLATVKTEWSEFAARIAPFYPVPDGCTHPERFQEYKIHLDESVCKCGARKDHRNPDRGWYRPETAIDHRTEAEKCWAV